MGENSVKMTCPQIYTFLYPKQVDKASKWRHLMVNPWYFPITMCSCICSSISFIDKERKKKMPRSKFTLTTEEVEKFIELARRYPYRQWPQNILYKDAQKIQNVWTSVLKRRYGWWVFIYNHFDFPSYEALFLHQRSRHIEWVYMSNKTDDNDDAHINRNKYW